MGRARMPVRRKVFRIETQLADSHPQIGETASGPTTQFLGELATLRSLVEGRRDGAPKIDADNAGPSDIEANSLRQLKDETDTIHRAITRTKQEIAALLVNGLNRPDS